MPVVPFAATVGTWMGASAATAAAVGGTAIVATAASVGASIYSSVSQAAAAKKAEKAAAASGSGTPDASQTVGETPNKTEYANNLGRAALISTSPTGVLGSDPSGRRRLLGND
jgi:hypothetical protein